MKTINSASVLINIIFGRYIEIKVIYMCYNLSLRKLASMGCILQDSPHMKKGGSPSDHLKRLFWGSSAWMKTLGDRIIVMMRTRKD